MGRNLEVFASNRLTARSGKAEKIISISHPNSIYIW